MKSQAVGFFSLISLVSGAEWDPRLQQIIAQDDLERCWPLTSAGFPHPQPNPGDPIRVLTIEDIARAELTGECALKLATAFARNIHCLKDMLYNEESKELDKSLFENTRITEFYPFPDCPPYGLAECLSYQIAHHQWTLSHILMKKLMKSRSLWRAESGAASASLGEHLLLEQIVKSLHNQLIDIQYFACQKSGSLNESEVRDVERRIKKKFKEFDAALKEYLKNLALIVQNDGETLFYRNHIKDFVANLRMGSFSKVYPPQSRVWRLRHPELDVLIPRLRREGHQSSAYKIELLQLDSQSDFIREIYRFLWAIPLARFREPEATAELALERLLESRRQLERDLGVVKVLAGGDGSFRPVDSLLKWLVVPEGYRIYPTSPIGAPAGSLNCVLANVSADTDQIVALQSGQTPDGQTHAHLTAVIELHSAYWDIVVHLAELYQGLSAMENLQARADVADYLYGILAPSLTPLHKFGEAVEAYIGQVRELGLADQPGMEVVERVLLDYKGSMDRFLLPWPFGPSQSRPLGAKSSSKRGRPADLLGAEPGAKKIWQPEDASSEMNDPPEGLAPAVEAPEDALSEMDGSPDIPSSATEVPKDAD